MRDSNTSNICIVKLNGHKTYDLPCTAHVKANNNPIIIVSIMRRQHPHTHLYLYTVIDLKMYIFQFNILISVMVLFPFASFKDRISKKMNSRETLWVRVVLENKREYVLYTVLRLADLFANN